MGSFLQEENEQLGRLTCEMQAQLGETVELLEKRAYSVARTGFVDSNVHPEP